MKKIITVMMAIILAAGCGSADAASSNDNYTGPVVTDEIRSDKELELEMIQNCINDYNSDNIEKIESEMATEIPHFPIGITSIPEIKSLSDLNELPDVEKNSNITYAGQEELGSGYSIVYMIYNPEGGNFWMNGGVAFEIDPADVQQNNPEFSDYAAALTELLPKQADILNGLFGIDVSVSEEEGPESGYHAFYSMGSQTDTYYPKTIDEMKQIAETVFTKDYLEQAYYPAAFEGESPVYKEINGQLYCAEADLSLPLPRIDYAPDYIVAAEEENSLVTINILYKNMGEIQPIIRTIQLVRTNDGFRLPSSY